MLRVACLGDSITFGSAFPEGADRVNGCYPAQLGAMLGPSYEVRNFGVGGATLLRMADSPFVETKAWREALAWQPDIAVVMLGTNDSCDGPGRPNWEHKDGLLADATAMAGELLEAGAGRVLLCGPTGMDPGLPGLGEARREDLNSRAPHRGEVRLALQEVARDLPLVEYHDLGHVLEAVRGGTTDGVHPTPFGAEAIALRLTDLIDPTTAPGIEPFTGRLADLPKQLAPARSTHLGFEREDFTLPGSDADAILVRPHGVARGAPWLWRMRFWGHEPELERQLLERGFHLAYVDVAGLFGAHGAIARMQELHGVLTSELGLAHRPVLLGMSRGGLPAVAWALRHPGLVAAVVGDNPVADLRSWPGGKTGERSNADWEAALVAHDWSEEQAQRQGGFLLSDLSALGEAAAFDAPLLLVLGMADEVVPPAENGLLLRDVWLDAGGDVELWTKPTAGHHPHGLHPPAPLVRAVQRAVGLGHNPALLARPSVEYRGHLAGWGGGTWHGQLEKIVAAAKSQPNTELVFFGDSITQGLTGSADRLVREGGERAIDQAFGAIPALGLGLSGDRTEHLLWRIEHGALAHVDPRVVVLQIGANNINAAGHSAAEATAGIEAVVASLREHEPQAEVLVCGPFPLGVEPTEERRRVAAEVHERIAALHDPANAVHVLDLWPLFLDEDGRATANLASDGIHATEAGRRAWMGALEPLVRELLED
ncbi:MAG: GDSL-type esterase/lipase family protein [Planctomycetota bacterium]|nr:GDSL-type esterase/lipase family protein [Planctomycetota bacterium]